MEEQGNIERIDQEHIAAKMLENSNTGKGVAVGVTGIVTLNEYMREKGLASNEQDEHQEDETEIKSETSYFVVPVTLPDGSSIDVIVNNGGEDIASIYTDKDGNVTSFEMSPSIKKELARSINGIETKLAPQAVLTALTPATLEELQRDLAEEHLVPDSKEDVVERVKTKYPEIPVNIAREDSESEEEVEQEVAEQEKAKDELPTEIRDEISRICSEHELDVRDLKEVMQVQPSTITSSLPNTGISNNGANVYCFKFKDKSTGTKDRIVMVQPGSEPIDERQYDEFVSDYMTEHRGQVPERETSDSHNSVYYTDIDGNTTVQEIEKRPMDLTCTQKEELQSELAKLDNSTSQIMNSGLSPEAKAEELTKINEKRLDLFEEYGIEVGSVSSEIQADIEIAEDIANDAQEQDEEENTNDDAEKEDSDSSRWLKAYGREHELPEGPWDSRNKYF